MRYTKKKWLVTALLLVGIAALGLAASLAAAPGEPRSTEIRREFYWDAEKIYPCGVTIRTCQGYILRDGCAEESLFPTPYYDVFIDPCFP